MQKKKSILEFLQKSTVSEWAFFLAGWGERPQESE